MSARILLTKRVKRVNDVVSGIWKYRYNHERWIIELIYENVETWSRQEIEDKLQSLSEKASAEP